MGTLKSDAGRSGDRTPPLLECWLPAELKAVPTARHRAMQVYAEAGLTEDECFALDLALGEALANAVVHGAAGTARIYLGLWNFQNRLIIQVQDYGAGFCPPLPPYVMPDAERHEAHGRGLPLMEMLTDAMAVCSGCVHEGGSSVFLIKRIPR